jgi:hypothetical protein
MNLTLADKLAFEKEAIRMEICQLLGITADQHSTAQFDYGCSYAMDMFEMQPVCGEYMIKTKSYWNWWQSDWWIVDKNLIRKLEVMQNRKQLTPQGLIEFWKEQHTFSVRNQLNIRPPASVFEEAYELRKGACTLVKIKQA